jgi:hypothetical protein
MLTCVGNGFRTWPFVHEPNGSHTLGVWSFEKLAYMIVSNECGRLLVMCPRGNLKNQVVKPWFDL